MRRSWTQLPAPIVSLIHDTMEKEQIEKIKCHASDLGWELFTHDENQKKLRFVRGNTVVDIWYTRMTVAIIKNGRQHFHKHVTDGHLDKLLDEN